MHLLYNVMTISRLSIEVPLVKGALMIFNSPYEINTLIALRYNFLVQQNQQIGEMIVHLMKEIARTDY